MKPSKRNIRNSVARAHERQSGPPKTSKYAAKRQAQMSQPEKGE